MPTCERCYVGQSSKDNSWLSENCLLSWSVKVFWRTARCRATSVIWFGMNQFHRRMTSWTEAVARSSPLACWQSILVTLTVHTSKAKLIWLGILRWRKARMVQKWWSQWSLDFYSPHRLLHRLPSWFPMAYPGRGWWTSGRWFSAMLNRGRGKRSITLLTERQFCQVYSVSTKERLVLGILL